MIQAQVTFEYLSSTVEIPMNSNQMQFECSEYSLNHNQLQKWSFTLVKLFFAKTSAIQYRISTHLTCFG
jgi:hypothetical protein